MEGYKCHLYKTTGYENVYGGLLNYRTYSGYIVVGVVSDHSLRFVIFFLTFNNDGFSLLLRGGMEVLFRLCVIALKIL